MASTKHRAAGFSLVEVLVSIVVLSVGLLGTVGMLLASVRTSNESATFTAALNLARELSEKARMNKGVAARNDAGNAYLVEDWRADAASGAASAVTACVGRDAACSTADLAAWDMSEWKRRIARALPDARLSVCFDEAPWNAAADEYTWACSKTGRTVVVKLGWTPRAGIGAKAQPSSAPRLVMQLVAGQVHDGQAGS
ncbi:type IV pilus assembly protein PilV [Variovorax boronicumulans]|uniref:type IV pilus modification protein PilV n=1 Tax=Variovorax boronicumulans TaxID=436515 RepID=UPI002475B5D6|nr:type IV pilus modification protein PilV [Variovorax boronicumulans]MDH6166177.1 type IV pilus assembly protein PilV [Variovorax boronicumulans]